MGLNVSRFVEIHISNKTRKVTLKQCGTYFFSGHVLNPPQDVAPGSSKSCKFTNNSLFWGANGVLAFEAESFTLAIYFSNPIDYNRFSVEMGLELSQDKVHKSNLQAVYERLVKISHQSPQENAMFPFVILKENQDEAQLNAGPVEVTATMARGRSAVISVTVRERGGSGVGSQGRDGQPRETRPGEVRTPAGPPGEPHGQPWNRTGALRTPQRPPEPRRDPWNPAETPGTP
ncbi:uncharacterized protein LOC116438904 [Corvus moneduloides]|uniref:uncharacterized protein LOC116438904 n=1 Tax=Corvus moneduloides TaxID=1196302 RepID=UPI0013626C32|nr:uncharacterized protein LOC116438904 [Corvus moneduloides]